ncbi:uncharacterized protein LOC116180856 [Photinus pyralis]|uniref:uncharacterized protein LOC116180856 n=1 Tax=Photinus pyralis TaxID=7054 RepID=UPI00126736DA|nr:uncharacterized protein LOC116180856 [Photinus pyralis]
MLGRNLLQFSVVKTQFSATPTPILPSTYTSTALIIKQEPRPFQKKSQNYKHLVPVSTNDDYYDVLPVYSKALIDSHGYVRCFDRGSFPHPASCRRFIYCAKIDSGHIVGWEYTCPKNLSFDPVGGICNWATELGCAS